MSNQTNRNISEIMRDEMTMRDKIISQLAESPRTIPEIADAINYPRYDVMLWIMTMWRYGYLREDGKPNAEGYFKFVLTE